MDTTNDERALARNQIQEFRVKKTKFEEELEKQRLQNIKNLVNDHLAPAADAVHHGLSEKLDQQLDALVEAAVDRATAEYKSSAGTMDEIRQAAEEMAGKEVAKQFVRPLPGHTYQRTEKRNGYVVRVHVELVPDDQPSPSPAPTCPATATATDPEQADGLIPSSASVSEPPQNATSSSTALPSPGPIPPPQPTSSTSPASSSTPSQTGQPSAAGPSVAVAVAGQDGVGDAVSSSSGTSSTWTFTT